MSGYPAFKTVATLAVITLLALAGSASAQTAAAVEPPATQVTSEPHPWLLASTNQLQLYFFWTESCPHCQAARPFVDGLEVRLPGVVVQSRPLDDHPDHVAEYLRLAELINENAYSVPAFIFCGQMITGFDSADGIGAAVESALTACAESLANGSAPWDDKSTQTERAEISLPVLGNTDLSGLSLPMVTVLLALLDSFNPCAFFVLLFLLSLLVNARSRTRMLLIGGLFVFVSGAVYLAFMAAWLNLFLVFGELAWLTAAAGVLALVMGAINLKDYFQPSRGPSLSIPEQAKPGLFARMRRLVAAENLSTMIAGTLLLAILANSYELLCTAGFPMVFTRILTLNDLSTASYYGYLLLYCGIYVIPLLVIVGVFTRTLGRRKLSAREGALLKLLSGLMMSGLGALLLLDPALISNPFVAALLILLALLLCWLIHRWRAPAVC